MSDPNRPNEPKRRNVLAIVLTILFVVFMVLMYSVDLDDGRTCPGTPGCSTEH